MTLPEPYPVPSSKLAAVILAAGESRRMGKDKALLPLPGALARAEECESFLAHAVSAFSEICDLVIVVAGKNVASLASVVGGARLVVNPDPSRGQFSSLQMGLRELVLQGCTAAFITLVDVPVASRETLAQLRDAYGSADGSAWAIVPAYRGEHGHPYIADRNLIDAFLRAPVTETAREIQRRNHAHIRYLTVDDPRVVLNINTPADYLRLAGECVSH